MDIIFSASIIAAFLAGMVALFAPCCITILLPTYIASAFREKKNILKMTLVFFGGISAILIPIGLGVAWLAKIFQNFHNELYIVGGSLMIVFAAMALFGKGISIIPMAKQSNPKIGGWKSVFLLGLFSGAATSCCAPVLAGAVTLAVISGAFWKALIVTFAYVFGMVFPLFLAAYFYDRFKLEKSKLIQGKIWEIKIGEKTFFFHSTNVFAAIIFLIVGAILLYLAFSGDAFWSPAFQVQIGNFLNRLSQDVFAVFSRIPDVVWGVVIIGIFGFLIYRAVKKENR